MPVPKHFHLIRSRGTHDVHVPVMEALAIACYSSEVSLYEDSESNGSGAGTVYDGKAVK